MDDLLVRNPIQYVLNFIGMKNEEELAIAIEIHLAEKVFEPRFDSFLKHDELQELDLKVRKLYRSFHTSELTALFYFNYINFAIETGVVDGSIINDFKMYVAEEMLREQDPKSRIAKNLLKTSDFYKTFHNNKANSLNESESLKKIMGLITLQNKELYDLEMERMKSFDEYKIYEKYRKELESAEISILESYSNSKMGL